jgi:hypothetical protein
VGEESIAEAHGLQGTPRAGRRKYRAAWVNNHRFGLKSTGGRAENQLMASTHRTALTAFAQGISGL